MKNKLVILTLILWRILISDTAFAAKPKIVASITPIAGIVAMLTQDSAQVSAINISAGCPRHYHMKPSDANKILNADLLIYIDDNFDSFTKKLAQKFQGEVIRAGDISSLNLNDGINRINRHFWLDLNNIIPLQEVVANSLINQFPWIKEAISSNLNDSVTLVKSLTELKKLELESLPQLIVVSDSLEHFFKNEKVDIIKFYQQNGTSLQNFSKLEQILNSDIPQCIILDSSQNENIYKRFKKKIVKLNSENWATKNNIIDANLFYEQYVDILHRLRDCKI